MKWLMYSRSSATVKWRLGQDLHEPRTARRSCQSDDDI